jgi:hypothetical protein
MEARSVKIIEWWRLCRMFTCDFVIKLYLQTSVRSVLGPSVNFCIHCTSYFISKQVLEVCLDLELIFVFTVHKMLDQIITYQLLWACTRFIFTKYLVWILDRRPGILRFPFCDCPQSL